ncbi:MAG: cytochrome c-type biogenesis CcmF C-terminal domain-containing protein, partial [Deinococcus sp.]
AHLGLVVVALGLAFSGSYKQSGEINLNKGQPATLLGERLELTGVQTLTYPYGSSAVAGVRLGDTLYSPRSNLYLQGGNTLYPTPAVRYGLLGDTYMVVTAFGPGGQWVSVRLIRSPLVSWIWVGTIIVVLGAGLTLVTPRAAARQRVAVGLQAAD